MNILFVVPYYKPAYIYGGPVVVIPLLAETLVSMGHSVTVFTSTANGHKDLPVLVEEEILVDGVRVFYFPRITGGNTHVSPALWKRLDSTINNFDVVHLHSWWNVLIVGAALICLRHHVTPVLSPHGMLSNYILNTNNAIKKKILQYIIGKRLLRNTYLHVSTIMEWEESHNVVPHWPGVIINNLVILPEHLSATYKCSSNENVFTIGFLSRIDPKKGLDILIRALSQVHFSYRLRIAGDGDSDYIQSLKELAISLGNADRLEWVGWQKGRDKFNFLESLDLFALISHSENFAIVVIEALACSIPVLISNQVGLHDYVTKYDYGWVTDLDLDAVCHQLNNSFYDNAKRTRIANVAPSAIRTEYNEKYLTQQYIDLYSSLPKSFK